MCNQLFYFQVKIFKDINVILTVVNQNGLKGKDWLCITAKAKAVRIWGLIN